MGLRLFLLRHAETSWNRERRYQGWTDTGLSDAGRTQAEAAGRALAGASLQAVSASPLRRAQETAAAIAAPHGLSVRVEEAFKEMGFGGWEGLTVEEARAQEPALYRTWLETPHLAGPPGGERLPDVKRRGAGGAAREPPLSGAWQGRPPRGGPPGGERLPDVKGGVLAGLERLREGHDE